MDQISDEQIRISLFVILLLWLFLFYGFLSIVISLRASQANTTSNASSTLSGSDGSISPGTQHLLPSSPISNLVRMRRLSAFVICILFIFPSSNVTSWMLWIVKIIIDSMQPALLVLFGSGGQAYLHLGSLWFVDIWELTFSGIVWRVLAGLYAAILSAIFLIPLLVAIVPYLSFLSDALYLKDRIPSLRQVVSAAVGGDPLISTSSDVPASQPMGSSSSSNNNNSGSGSAVSASSANSLSSNGGGSSNAIASTGYQQNNNNKNQTGNVTSWISASNPININMNSQQQYAKRPLLKKLDMNFFEILCALGSGTTSKVVLAREVSRKYIAEEDEDDDNEQGEGGNIGNDKDDDQSSGFHIEVDDTANDLSQFQAGSLFVSNSDRLFAPDAIPPTSNHIPAIKQQGSLFVIPKGDADDSDFKTQSSPSQSSLHQRDFFSEGDISDSGSLHMGDDSNVSERRYQEDVLNEFLDEIVDESMEEKHDYKNSNSKNNDNNSNKSSKKSSMVNSPARIGPGGFEISRSAFGSGTFNMSHQIGPGGPKLEPFTPYPNSSSEQGNSLFRSRSISTSISPSIRPLAQKVKSVNILVSPETKSTKLNHKLSLNMKNTQLGGKLSSRSKSVPTALNELVLKSASAAPDPNDKEWWKPLQWYDNAQRTKSGMDNIYAEAPGLLSLESKKRDPSEVSLSMTTKNNASSTNLLEMGRSPGLKPKSSGVLNSAMKLPPTVPAISSSAGDFSNSALRQTSNPQSNENVEVHHMTILNRSSSDVPKSTLLETSSLTSLQALPPSSSSNSLVQSEHEDESVAELSPLDLPDLVAIKIMHRPSIEKMKMRSMMEQEKKLLGMCYSPFVVELYGAFQDNNWAYLLLEPVPAGDLAGLLEQRQVMFETEAKFYVGCLLLALEHLHDRGIACLDIKPENLLLDQWGYLKLCDLGIARIVSSADSKSSNKSSSSSSLDMFFKRFDSQRGNEKEESWDFVGTPEYMSPEVIKKKNIEKGLVGISGPDIWAVGILIFELLVGETPFSSDSDAKTLNSLAMFFHDYDRIRNARAKKYQRWSYVSRQKDSNPEDPLSQIDDIDDDDCFPFLTTMKRKSLAAADLIRRLMRPNPKERLGSSGDGARSVMKHPWFNDVDWEKLRKRELRAPFIPNPATLAPPFRGEQVSVDITRDIPLTLSSLQFAQDYLNDPTSLGKNINDVKISNPWTGFSRVSRVDKISKSGGFLPADADPSTSISPSNITAKESKLSFLKIVRHVEELFKDINDDSQE